MVLYLTSVASDVIDKLDFKGKTKTAFIATAAEPYEDKWFVKKDKEALGSVGLFVTDVDIKDKTREELFNILKEFEIIFVAGGNTFYLLEQMNNCEFKDVLLELLNKEVIYVGSSAGSIVLCPDIEFISSFDDRVEAKGLNSTKGLALVDFYVFPHYGAEKYALKTKQVFDKYANLELIPLRDNQFIKVVAGEKTIY